MNILVFMYFLFCPILVAMAQQYELVHQRGRDTITLSCRTSGEDVLNLETNTAITFWVNRTQGVRASEPNLREIGDLQGRVISGTNFLFYLTPELEGNYTCGRITDENGNAIESNAFTLISFERSGIPELKQIAIESGGTAVLPCPIQVGKLSACYYGNWFKNGTMISSVQSPGANCASPKSSENLPGFPEGKYSVNVQDEFSLTINSALPSDSGDDYQCELLSINPESSSTVQYGRSIVVTLSVGADPIISEGPKDVVVKDIPSKASFNCTVAGKPLLPVTWSYSATLAGDQPLTADNSEVITTNLTDDESGRSRVVSTLLLSITPTDGGTVTCTTGDSTSTASLTVLGAPKHITHLTTINGDIIYTVLLPVRLNRPTRLNITYVNGNNEVLLPTMMTTPPMEYSDTDSIVYQENKATLPTTKYRVQAALYVDMGSQVIQGPASLSSQTIDAGELSRGAVIGISAGVGACVVTIVVLLAVIVILIMCLRGLRRRGKAARLFGTISEVLVGLDADEINNPGVRAKIQKATKLLNKIQNILKIAHDGVRGGDEEADRAQLLGNFKSSLQKTLDVIERLDSHNEQE